jgi:hypothetical protein
MLYNWRVASGTVYCGRCDGKRAMQRARIRALKRVTNSAKQGILSANKSVFDVFLCTFFCV